MVVAIFYDIIVPVFSRIMLWFNDLIVATDTYGIYMAMITVFLVVHYICAPFIHSGGRGSDKARKVKESV